MPPKLLTFVLLAVASASIGTASAGAAEPTAQSTGPGAAALQTMSGTIDVQRNGFNGQLSLGRGNISLDATLTDTGPQGQFNFGVPDRFSLSLSRAEGVGQSTICAIVGPQEVTLTGAQGSGVHVEFQAADTNTPGCGRAATRQLQMAPFITAAQTDSLSESGAVQEDGVELARRLILLALTAGLLFLFAPTVSRPLAVAARARPWSRLGLGLCMVITVPIVGVLIFVLGLSMGLWWLGLLVLTAFVFLLALSAATAGLVLGMLLLEHVHQPRLPSALMLGLGLLLIAVLGLIPGVGPIISVLAVIYGAGVLLLLPRSVESQPTAMPLTEQPAIVGEPVADSTVSSARAA